MAFLEHWLIDHIVTADFEMVTFLRSENMGAKSDPFRRVEVCLQVDENKADLIRDVARFLDSQSETSDHLQGQLSKLIEDRKSRALRKARDLFCA